MIYWSAALDERLIIDWLNADEILVCLIGSNCQIVFMCQKQNLSLYR